MRLYNVDNEHVSKRGSSASWEKRFHSISQKFQPTMNYGDTHYQHITIHPRQTGIMSCNNWTGISVAAHCRPLSNWDDQFRCVGDCEM